MLDVGGDSIGYYRAGSNSCVDFLTQSERDL